MTKNEISRLCEWLRTMGYTPDDINDCIKYISMGKVPEAPNMN